MTSAGGVTINPVGNDEEPRSLRVKRASTLLEQAWQDNAVAALARLPETCALDAADRGDHTLDEVGALIGVTRERVRQLGDAALKAMKSRLQSIGVHGSNETEQWNV